MAVTADELPLSRFLMGIRSIPRRMQGKAGVLEAARMKPVVQTFREGGFREVCAAPPRLFVAGAAIQPWRLVQGEVADVKDAAGFKAFDRPGFVLTAISFELEPVPTGTRLATETRIQPTDQGAARAFLPYWLAIRVGSGLIRRDLLRAVARRSELSSKPTAR